MAEVGNLADWRGKPLIDCDGERIGKLEDVYVDVETDEPVFGTVKEGLIGRHLTFVPLQGAVASPEGLQVGISKGQIESAPNINSEGELGQQDESELYHHFQLNYVAPGIPSGRRLAKR